LQDLGAYISSILSKNEVERDDRYNRKLFLRMRRGHYIINPKLSVRVEGEWRKIYDLLSLDMVAYKHLQHYFFDGLRFNRRADEQLQQFRDKVRVLADG